MIPPAAAAAVISSRRARFSSSSRDRSFWISSKASAFATAVVTGRATSSRTCTSSGVKGDGFMRPTTSAATNSSPIVSGTTHGALGTGDRHTGPVDTRVGADVVEDQRPAVALHGVAQEGGVLPFVPGRTGCFREPPHVGLLALAGGPRSAAEVDRASPDRLGFVGDDADQIDRHEPLERARQRVQHARQVAPRVRRLRHGQERLVLRLARPASVHATGLVVRVQRTR